MTDADDPVFLDIEKIDRSLKSGCISPPSGLSGSQRRQWLRENFGKAGPLFTDDKMKKIVIECRKFVMDSAGDDRAQP